MIFALRGRIYRLEPMRLLLDVGNTIYDIATPALCSMYFQKEPKDQDVFLFISQIIREDCHLLFGFSSEEKKQMFERLIKINGVGPKVALAILSTYECAEILEIVRQKNAAAFQRVPGIGAKGAGKIMVDLAGFYVEVASGKPTATLEAKMALESLGFKAPHIDKVLKMIQAHSTQEIIKEALKLLSRT